MRGGSGFGNDFGGDEEEDMAEYDDIDLSAFSHLDAKEVMYQLGDTTGQNQLLVGDAVGTFIMDNRLDKRCAKALRDLSKRGQRRVLRELVGVEGLAAVRHSDRGKAVMERLETIAKEEEEEEEEEKRMRREAREERRDRGNEAKEGPGGADHQDNDRTIDLLAGHIDSIESGGGAGATMVTTDDPSNDALARAAAGTSQQLNRRARRAAAAKALAARVQDKSTSTSVTEEGGGDGREDKEGEEAVEGGAGNSKPGC